MASGKGTHWSTDPKSDAVPLKVGSEGLAARTPATTDAFLKAAAEDSADVIAIREQNPETKEWTELTYAAYYDQARAAAKSFLKLGLERYEGVAIIGFNSTEWFLADMGCVLAGGIAAGIYTTNGPDACLYIVDHCKARVVFAEDNKQLEKFMSIREKMPNVSKYVVYKGDIARDEEGKSVHEDVINWSEFMELGKDVSDETLQERMDSQKPEDTSTLIYTSGTTGPPKAVMITHDNLTWTSATICEAAKIPKGDQHIISFLPLSHIAAQMVDIYMSIYVRATVTFARPDALRGSLGETMRHVRPTLFLGVPRVWEKIQEKMAAIAKSRGWLARKIGAWAKGKGADYVERLQKGDTSKPWLFGLANALVFKKVRAALGLDRCTHQFTAAAPIRRETLDYFASLVIPIYEIYGMSECTGPETVSLPMNFRTGSCGRVFDGAEIKLDQPDAEGNGEICMRGRHVFRGYMYNDEATDGTIDADGWLHSGDIGRLTDDGFLYITGRIKELIITAGGENIPPVLIEDQIKKELPCISNVQVIGDKRKFLSCVITLKSVPNAEAQPTTTLAKDVTSIAGVTATTMEEARTDAALRAHIEEGIKRANKNATSRAQNVAKFEILPEDFTIDGGELTPTLKLKRRIVEQKYSEIIEGMYEV